MKQEYNIKLVCHKKDMDKIFKFLNENKIIAWSD